jgi:hypothetical protein
MDNLSGSSHEDRCQNPARQACWSPVWSQLPSGSGLGVAIVLLDVIRWYGQHVAFHWLLFELMHV